MKLVFAVLLGALTTHAADNSALAHLTFQGSFMHGQSRIVVVPFDLVF